MLAQHALEIVKNAQTTQLAHFVIHNSFMIQIINSVQAVILLNVIRVLAQV